MNDPEEQQNYLVQISNTDYLRLLMQTDPQYRDRYWCYQLEEQLRRMEFISHYRRFEIERRILKKLMKTLKKHIEEGKVTAGMIKSLGSF